MFKRLVTHKRLKAKTILFDTWYGSVANLKLIHRSGWTFFTTPQRRPLKSNRLVSLDPAVGYQHLDELCFDERSLVKGLIVKLKECPFMVKLFNGAARRMVAPNGDIDWVITNDLDHAVNLFVAEIKNDNRWQVERGAPWRIPQGLQAVDGFGKVPVPQGPLAAQPLGLLLPCLGFFQGKSKANEDHGLPGQARFVHRLLGSTIDESYCSCCLSESPS